MRTGLAVLVSLAVLCGPAHAGFNNTPNGVPGVDPTGFVDSTAAINAALTATVNVSTSTASDTLIKFT